MLVIFLGILLLRFIQNTNAKDYTGKNDILVTGKFDSFVLQSSQFLNLLLPIITKQIHVAKQKHAFIQHPFDKGWHQMNSILLGRNNEIFQLPALLCFNRGKVSVF